MSCTRRVFLKNTAVLSAASGFMLLNTGCLHKESSAANSSDVSGNSLDMAQPASTPALAHLPPPDRTVLVLNRISFGISQAALDRAYSIGIDAFIEEQLNPQSIADPVESEVALRYPMTLYSGEQLQTDNARYQLRDAALMRMCYSPRQLYEIMVDFWSNHFSIDIRIDPVTRYKVLDDREVIRPHALGRFRDLLYASAKSAAMLRFLDNVSNTKKGSNENYARELMELHTLGIDGGYTEHDVQEVARCFTGWQYDASTLAFQFNADLHDDGEKTVLGQVLPAGQGQFDGEQVLEILLAHPSTGRFLACKLVRRFVSDVPPESLVTRVAAAYTLTDGDISSMLREILASEEFLASADEKMKRPLEYLCAAIRALAPQLDHYNGQDIVTTLETLGQVPFEWPTPDGYPDTADYWLSAMGMAARWEFALQLAENTPGGNPSHAEELIGDAETANALVNRFADRILHRPLTTEARQALVDTVTENSYEPDELLPVAWLPDKAGLVAASLLGSPYFMLR
jgi:uncharacterized protein (DUF1800 family)